jgi:hypothetical protein
MILLLDWVTLIGQFVLGSGLAYLAFSLTSDASCRPSSAGTTSPSPASRWLPAPSPTTTRAHPHRTGTRDAGHRRQHRPRTAHAAAGHTGRRRGPVQLPADADREPTSWRRPRAAGGAIRTAHLDSLRGVLERIDSEARQSNAIIDMLLVNARSPAPQAGIANLLDGRLRRNRAAALPLLGRRARLVSWDKGDDFEFRGVELLMVHVLFNLIKNALRHIAQAGKGEITMRIEASPTPSPDRPRQRRRHPAGRAAAHLRALLHLHR